MAGGPARPVCRCLAPFGSSEPGVTARPGGTAETTGTAAVQGEGRNLVDPNAYFVDALLRSDHLSPDRNDVSVHAEVSRIFANALRERAIPAADKIYLAQLVTAKTGLNQADAEKRVSEVTAEAQQAADTARKAAAHLSLWIFVALLIGAFCASYAATIGGRQRDHVKLV